MMRLSWYHRETIGNADMVPDEPLDTLPKRLRTIFGGLGCRTLRDCAAVPACEFILVAGVGYKTLALARRLLCNSP